MEIRSANQDRIKSQHFFFFLSFFLSSFVIPSDIENKLEIRSQQIGIESSHSTFFFLFLLFFLFFSFLLCNSIRHENQIGKSGHITSFFLYFSFSSKSIDSQEVGSRRTVDGASSVCRPSGGEGVGGRRMEPPLCADPQEVRE